MKRIFTIGDSFCVSHWIKPPDDENEYFWVSELEKKLLDFKIINNGHPSRDVQTIIDIWIKTLKYVKQDDVIIVCLPFFKRTRLPLHQVNYIHNVNENYEMITRFIGTYSYNNNRETLEFWGKEKSSQFFQDKLSYQEIINSSKSNQLNTIDIIESLIEFSKIKTYVFTWDIMDFKSKYIEDKNDITDKIGFWETHYDVYKNTDGKFGMVGDFHWSHKMNKAFSEYVYNKLFR